LPRIDPPHGRRIRGQIFDQTPDVLFRLIDKFGRRSEADTISRQWGLRQPIGIGKPVQIVLWANRLAAVREKRQPNYAHEA